MGTYRRLIRIRVRPWARARKEGFATAHGATAPFWKGIRARFHFDQELSSEPFSLNDKATQQYTLYSTGGLKAKLKKYGFIINPSAVVEYQSEDQVSRITILHSVVTSLGYPV